MLSAHPACDGRKLEPRECVIGVAHKVRGSHTLLLPEGEECRGQEGMVDTGNLQCVRCVPQTDEVGVPLSDSIIIISPQFPLVPRGGYRISERGGSG